MRDPKNIGPILLSKAVTDALADSLREEIGCDLSAAQRLAARARELVPRIAGGADDRDEDLVHRLRDPSVFGGIVESLLEARDLTEAERISLVEHAFDLLPLPRSEGDVILVGARAPRHLLLLASFLMTRDAFSVLHFLHLVYAVFLDRSLVTNVDRAPRSSVLSRVVADAEASENLRVLYACLHLSSIPETEARVELRALLKSQPVPASTRRLLATVVAAEDGGITALAEIARAEGLLPAGAKDPREPAVLANIPRMSDRLSTLGRRWLGRSGGG